MAKKLTKNSTLAEVLSVSGSEKILAKYKLPCLTCPFAQFEIDVLRIGEVCKLYDIQLEKVLKELNKKK